MYRTDTVGGGNAKATCREGRERWRGGVPKGLRGSARRNHAIYWRHGKVEGAPAGETLPDFLFFCRCAGPLEGLVR